MEEQQNLTWNMRRARATRRQLAKQSTVPPFRQWIRAFFGTLPSKAKAVGKLARVIG